MVRPGRRLVLEAAAAAAAMTATGTAVRAQGAWPAGKPIRLVIPSGAGRRRPGR